MNGHNGSSYVPLLQIVLAWVAALALAAGHHAFCAALTNTIPSTAATLRWNSQAGASAINNAFAHLVSAALGVSAGTAFLQCAWKVVRKRALTVSGLDALWSSRTSMSAFLSGDFWKNARGIVMVSAIAWAFPLIVTFAPGTLTVGTSIVTTSSGCLVPAFDFGSSALLHDELNSVSKIYLRPSSLALRVVGATILGGRPLPPASPCGNCSYLISTSAPSFSCSLGAQNSDALTWPEQSVLFDPPPYVAVNLDITPSVNAYTGWDFEAEYTDYTSWGPADGGTNITCIVYNSTYHLNYTFVGSTASVSIEQIDQLQPASQLTDPDGDFLPDQLIHTAGFNATANYYAVLATLYSYLVGNITVFETGDSINFAYNPTSLALPETALVSSPSSVLPAGNLTWNANPTEAMQSLLQNISLSILTGSFDATQTTPTTCVYTDTLPFFTYHPHRLWLIYALGLGVTLLCDFVGMIALAHNARDGVGATKGRFSDFLKATRNGELDALLDLQKDEAERVRLKYGPVRSEGGRYAFARRESLYETDGGKERQRDSPLLT
ncbi:hypothetical protein MSAN_00775200 [Mycena sanguinolenta]|uniref:Uncharacterized protein n=1 Tax=Mycena sanguinolenta TaxID=230812 RepID=A0A8H6Z5U0_9AGAR|nr:hypothetical protein MSAN_00775200 [Mycena sanguinolenta]